MILLGAVFGFRVAKGTVLSWGYQQELPSTVRCERIGKYYGDGNTVVFVGDSITSISLDDTNTTKRLPVARRAWAVELDKARAALGIVSAQIGWIIAIEHA